MNYSTEHARKIMRKINRRNWDLYRVIPGEIPEEQATIVPIEAIQINNGYILLPALNTATESRKSISSTNDLASLLEENPITINIDMWGTSIPQDFAGFTTEPDVICLHTPEIDISVNYDEFITALETLTPYLRLT